MEPLELLRLQPSEPIEGSPCIVRIFGEFGVACRGSPSSLPTVLAAYIEFYVSWGLISQGLLDLNRFPCHLSADSGLFPSLIQHLLPSLPGSLSCKLPDLLSPYLAPPPKCTWSVSSQTTCLSFSIWERPNCWLIPSMADFPWAFSMQWIKN